MEPTSNTPHVALTAQLVRAAAECRLAEKQYVNGHYGALRDTGTRLAVLADDIVGLVETLLHREEDARWSAAVDRATRTPRKV